MREWLMELGLWLAGGLPWLCSEPASSGLTGQLDKDSGTGQGLAGEGKEWGEGARRCSGPGPGLVDRSGLGSHT